MKRNYQKIMIFLLLLMLGLTGCSGDTEQQSIKEYKIQEMDGLASTESIDFLKSAVSRMADIKLESTNEVYEKSLYLVTDATYAEKLGYSLTEMNEEAFVITNCEDSIYLLAPTEEGLNRASAYFAQNYLEEDGQLTLDVGENYVENGKLIKEAVYVGTVPVEEYAIIYSSDEVLPVCQELQYYIQQTDGTCLTFVKESAEEPVEGKGIRFLLTEDPTVEGSTDITFGEITFRAGSVEALCEEMYLFVNTYLGWMNAGEEDAHISNTASVMRIPDHVDVREAWIEEREAIITLWNVNYSRGAYLDADVSLKNNLIDFSEDQLYEYVKMLKYCGFTGIQVTEMCSTWAGVGSYEACHEKIRMLADAAHSLDMKFTLWVWGSEFADCGWVDDDVTYDYNNKSYTFENPEVVECFDKYYDIYAELADCCDRVIGHYYDPGNVYTAEEIAFYSKMLKNKFQAVNPDIDFGISCWVDIYDKQIFIDELGTDITLYECGQRADEKTYETFREEISELGCRLGTWAWNTCEMEIDQLAQMNFNMEIIRSVYQTARRYDDIAKPTYWSEMDSYHLLNVFSLYCAGQLLIDPDTESEMLYQQISMAAVGPEYMYDFAEMLSVIQDARSGYSWDTYFWSNDNYILKSDDYPAERIVELCNRLLPVLEEMIEKEVESYTLPLPVSLQDLLKMMQPHLVQIRDYAEFRIALKQLETDYAQGADRQELEARLYEIADPIKDYNCVIGAWGQIEARAQYEMVTDFCERTGLAVPVYESFHTQRKQHIVAQLISYQKEEEEPYILGAPYYQHGLAYGQEETNRLVQELVEEGIFIRTEDGSVYLEDWENYKYHFDS
uniref:hypothetical protein n=1 Tax=Acetatifactor sp. TaxID=1872090 RepID=UPI004056C0E3